MSIFKTSHILLNTLFLMERESTTQNGQAWLTWSAPFRKQGAVDDYGCQFLSTIID